MDLTDKIVLAHKGYFNAESKKSYRENSREVCQIASSRDYISIIELDLRKSLDEVLYCYHGNPIEYFLTLKFPRNFEKIKQKYNVNTLAEILEVISDNKIIFLDIKDANITKEDILNVFSGRKFKEIILAARTVSFLGRFNGMPKEFVKFLNMNVFSPFYNLKKLRDKNFKYIEAVFPFQVSRKLIKKVEENGLQLRVMASFFLNKETYWRKIDKYNLKQISSDFM